MTSDEVCEYDDSHEDARVSDIFDVTAHPAAVMSLLKTRLEKGLMFTWMSTLVSLNPYKWSLSGNSQDIRNSKKMAPDVAAIAELAISQLSDGQPQLLCFHGESGSGKTENLQSELAYTAAHSLGTEGADLSPEQRHIEHSLIHANAVFWDPLSHPRKVRRVLGQDGCGFVGGLYWNVGSKWDRAEVGSSIIS